MARFYPMSSGDRWYLLAVIAFAVISFLPWSWQIEVAGMALFGWLMAALMVFSPAIALVRLLKRHNRQPEAEGQR